MHDFMLNMYKQYRVNYDMLPVLERLGMAFGHVFFLFLTQPVLALEFRYQMSTVIKVAEAVARQQKRIVVVGTGWAGFRFLGKLDRKQFDVVVISPRDHFISTPLLAVSNPSVNRARSDSQPRARPSEPLNSGRLSSRFVSWAI